MFHWYISFYQANSANCHKTQHLEFARACLHVIGLLSFAIDTPLIQISSKVIYKGFSIKPLKRPSLERIKHSSRYFYSSYSTIHIFNLLYLYENNIA